MLSKAKLYLVPFQVNTGSSGQGMSGASFSVTDVGWVGPQRRDVSAPPVGMLHTLGTALLSTLGETTSSEVH